MDEQSLNRLIQDKTLTQGQLLSMISLFAKGLPPGRMSRQLRALTIENMYVIGTRGIFNRIMFAKDTGCQYVAGQSYPDEIKVIRKILTLEIQ